MTALTETPNLMNSSNIRFFVTRLDKFQCTTHEPSISSADRKLGATHQCPFRAVYKVTAYTKETPVLTIKEVCQFHALDVVHGFMDLGINFKVEVIE